MHQTPRSLLLVEDDPSTLKIMGSQFKSHGHSVDLANNGEDALQLLKNNHYDLLLLDLEIPKIDGYEILRQIKQTDEFNHMPVIVITAMSEKADMQRCLNLQPDACIHKPTTIHEIEQCIEKCLTQQVGN